MQFAFSAFFHAEHALIPSFDDSTCAEHEIEGPAPIDRGVELPAVFKSACVVDGHQGALDGGFSSSFDQFGDFQFPLWF